MYNYTHENHFKFGYNDEYFNLRKSPTDIWNVTYGRCKRQPGNFREECVHAAKLIRQNTNSDIYVLLSGGLDSEIVARSFIEADIDITCIIGRFNGFMNEHDIRYAINFCIEYEVKYEFLDINIIDFWKYKLYKYASSTGCISPQLPIVMYIADQVDGHAVLGSGECYLVQNHLHVFELWEKEKIASWYRHFLINNKEGTPGFFQYTPELMLSFINDKIITEIKDKCEGVSTYYEKTKLYKEYWPELKDRKIYTGFEKYEELDYNLYRPYLEAKFGHYNQVAKTNISKLKDMLSPIICEEVSIDEVKPFKKKFIDEGLDFVDGVRPNVEKLQWFRATINGEVVGFRAVERFKGNVILLRNGYTFPKHRRKKVHTTLMKYIVDNIGLNDETSVNVALSDHTPSNIYLSKRYINKGFYHRKTVQHDDHSLKVFTCKYGDLKWK